MHSKPCALRTFLLAVAFVFIVAATPWAAEAPQSFTVVLLPDTQNYSEKFPETYDAQMTWIKSHAQEDNIKFVIHLGDIVQNWNQENEWQVSDKAMRIIEGVVPYSVAPGNHDLDEVNETIIRDSKLYNKYFPPSRFEKYPWYGGHMGDNNKNNFCTFEAAGMKFLVLSFEFAPPREAVEWAAGVVDSHKDYRVIVATHYYMRPKGRIDDPKPDGVDGLGPEELWKAFVSKHANIFMVVSGHVSTAHHQVSTNDAGGKVFELLCDYQAGPNGGDGWLQTLRFAPAEDMIYVQAYSPKLDKRNEESPHSYVLDYEMPG